MWGMEKLKTKKEKPKLKSKKLRREHEDLERGWTEEKNVPQMIANGTYAKTVFRINMVIICKNGFLANRRNQFR
jgi:hypothetical protein